MWISGELAACRVPDLALLEAEPAKPTFAVAAERWLASRIDVAEATRRQNRTSAGRAFPVIGDPRVDELTAQDVADLVVQLHGEGVAVGFLRKIQQAVARPSTMRAWSRTRLATSGSCGCLAASRRRSTRRAPRRSSASTDCCRPGTGCRCCSSTGAARGRARSTSRWSVTTTSSGDASGYVRRRRRHGGRCAATCTPCSPTRSRRVSARDLAARWFAHSGSDALRTALAKGVQGGGGAAVQPARPTPSHLAPPPARSPLGADRRVRRPAEPRDDRERLLARDAGRDGARLRRPPGRNRVIRATRFSPGC
jgi:hypothetical protein